VLSSSPRRGAPNRRRPARALIFSSGVIAAVGLMMLGAAAADTAWFAAPFLAPLVVLFIGVSRWWWPALVLGVLTGVLGSIAVGLLLWNIAGT